MYRVFGEGFDQSKLQSQLSLSTNGSDFRSSAAAARYHANVFSRSDSTLMQMLEWLSLVIDVVKVGEISLKSLTEKGSRSLVYR